MQVGWAMPMWGRTPSSVRSSGSSTCFFADTSTDAITPKPSLPRTSRDIHNSAITFYRSLATIWCTRNTRKPAFDVARRENVQRRCTKSGQRLVHGLHLIENSRTCRCGFFIDEKTGRSKTGSFFDSFLSFSGWCGVRGSSGVTVLIARFGTEGEQGSIAKRWSRRTEKTR